jgi:putative toxin-antitoxin system antitoxin component (TIGR02293 family)
MTAATIAHLLGGRSVLGRNVRTDSELIAAVRDGLPFLALRHLFDEFASTDLVVQEMYSLVGSLRTLQRKQAARTRLTAAESDRVARVARVLARAEEAIGDKARARRWLTEPTAALGGHRPLELLDSDLGTGQVERVLGRIEYGVYE